MDTDEQTFVFKHTITVFQPCFTDCSTLHESRFVCIMMGITEESEIKRRKGNSVEDVNLMPDLIFA